MPNAKSANAANERQPTILLVEDDAGYAERMRRNLAAEGMETAWAPNGKEALETLRSRYFDLVVTDVRMPSMTGTQLLERVRSGHERDVDRDVPIVFLTSVGELDLAVDAMRQGAADFITKDAERREIVLRLRRALERSRLVNENRLLRDQLERRSKAEFGEIVGKSPAAQALKKEIALLANSSASALFLGETGVGKGLVARALHDLGERPNSPFVDVNCAALPDENMFQSELFGHEPGAFTGATQQRRGRFEQADGGTLFLDEVGELSPVAQAKLLKSIETREFTRLGGSKPIKVSCRILYATNRDLAKQVADGKFREDLYYRVNVMPVPIPPLRERRDDIPLLAAFFAGRFAAEYNRPRPLLEPAFAEALKAFSWPGNIRELRNVMERLVIRCAKDSLSVDDLAGVGLAAPGAGNVGAGEGRSLYDIPDEGVDLELVERKLVEAALAKADWNQKEAARLLNISNDRMNARVKKFGIRHPSWRRNK